MADAPAWDSLDLTPFLAQLGIDDPTAIVNARELSGGASKDTWIFEVRLPDGDTRSYIVRRTVHTSAAYALGIDGEYAVMRAAFETGVHVPEPLYQATDAYGNPFMVMTFVEGETLAPRLLRRDEYAEARRKMARQLGEFVAPIHRVPVSGALTAVLGPIPDRNPAAQAMELFRQVYDLEARNPHPVFELAFRHLQQTLPETYDIGLVHGDYRLGNVIFGPEGLRSVLDWELAHWGDPMEDLAWTMVRAWRFGRDDHPVAGCGTREELWAGYEAADGHNVDRARAHWWEIFSNLRWGVITLMQGVRYIDGDTMNLEKGAIGRRAAEVEGQLLNLIRE